MAVLSIMSLADSCKRTVREKDFDRLIVDTFQEGVWVTKQDKTIDPELFYESVKGTRDSVFLVEAYNERKMRHS